MSLLQGADYVLPLILFFFDTDASFSGYGMVNLSNYCESAFFVCLILVFLMLPQKKLPLAIEDTQKTASTLEYIP